MGRTRTGKPAHRPRRRGAAEAAARDVLSGRYDGIPAAIRVSAAALDHFHEHCSTTAPLDPKGRDAERFKDFRRMVIAALEAIPGSLSEKWGNDHTLGATLNAVRDKRMLSTGPRVSVREKLYRAVGETAKGRLRQALREVGLLPPA